MIWINLQQQNSDKMKKITALFTFIALSVSNSWAQKHIEVSNPITENRVEIISIPYGEFSRYFNVDSIFTIKDKNSQKIYLHQLEKLGHKDPINVLIQIPIASKENLSLVVTNDKSPSFSSKTFARYVPERFDDFAWENDVVAFRMYGKALEGRNDDAQGIDFWAKRTSDLIINKWYKEEDYHQDHGQGLDYYAVGQTLGVGDIALYFDDKIHFTKHYRKFKLLDNGPLRTTFQLIFEEEEISSNKISITKTITLDAGQQFNRTSVFVHNKTNISSPVVFGLARRAEEKPQVYFNPKNKSLTYWEPAVKEFGQTGTALILPDSKVEFLQENKKQFLLKTNIKSSKSITYYNGASWSKAGKLNSAEDWKNYVDGYAKRLKKPLKVKLK